MKQKNQPNIIQVVEQKVNLLMVYFGAIFYSFTFLPSALNLTPCTILSYYATEKVKILKPVNKILIRNVLLEDFLACSWMKGKTSHTF